MSIKINPNSLEAFGRHTVVLTGRARRYYVPSFAAPLSIKWVCSGRAAWTTGKRRRVVAPDSLLVLPDFAEYAIEIDEPVPAETFCVFFEAGLVSQAWQDVNCPHSQILDSPAPLTPLTFEVNLESSFNGLGGLLRQFYGDVRRGLVDRDLEAWEFSLARATANHVRSRRQECERLSAVRAGTRNEIYRRLNLAVDRIESTLSNPWGISAMAEMAAMSPFHFQRCFKEAFGETPLSYLRRRRLERAVTLLQSGKSVTETCLLIGVASIGSFSTAFHSQFGVTPSSVKKEYRGALPASSHHKRE